jgi:NADH:ubiquinone oxidoreductase subunit E
MAGENKMSEVNTVNIEEATPIIEKFKTEQGSVVGLLQDIHGTFGYLPEEVLQKASKDLDIPLSRFFSLATFYTSFRLEPMGKHHICTCVGTACHVKGASGIVEAFKRELKVEEGETTEDGQFTFDTVNCLGACALAPLVTIDGDYYGKTKQNKVGKLLENYQTTRKD